jgi:anti-sigma B factor antagonist
MVLMRSEPIFEAPVVRFRHQIRDGDVALVVAGEIDLSNADSFDAQLQRLLNAAHSPAYVDLSGVSFFDSTGLGALVRASARAAQLDVSLRLVKPSPRVRRVFAITGVTDHFDILD